MKKLTAIYRDGRNGGTYHITSEYSSKKDFATDIKANGLRLVHIFTEEEIVEAKKMDKYDINLKLTYKTLYKEVAYQYAQEVL